MKFIAQKIEFIWTRMSVRFAIALCVLMQSHFSFACEKTITIHASKNWVPYSYEVNDVFQGLDIEVLELVLGKANICWQYVSMPSSSRAFAELKKGNIDLVFAASVSEERSEYANFTSPYRTESAVLYTHVDNNFPANLTSSTSVAINRGGFYGDDFADFRQQCESCVIDISLASQRFYLLKNKRVDFVIEDSLAGKYVVSNAEYASQIKKTDSVVHNNFVHYMIAKNSLSEVQLAEVNRAIKESKQEIKALLHKYELKL